LTTRKDSRGSGGATVAVGGVVEAAAGVTLAANGSFNLAVGNNYGKGPPANDGVAKPHGGSDHNAKIDDHIQSAKDKNATDVRKNQVQVDADGNRVGNNVVDAQYNDVDGVHNCYEVDHSATRSQNHVNTITKNDPKTNVWAETIPKKK